MSVTYTKEIDNCIDCPNFEITKGQAFRAHKVRDVVSVSCIEGGFETDDNVDRFKVGIGINCPLQKKIVQRDNLLKILIIEFIPNDFIGDSNFDISRNHRNIVQDVIARQYNTTNRQCPFNFAKVTSPKSSLTEFIMWSSDLLKLKLPDNSVIGSYISFKSINYMALGQMNDAVGRIKELLLEYKDYHIMLRCNFQIIGTFDLEIKNKSKLSLFMIPEINSDSRLYSPNYYSSSECRSSMENVSIIMRSLGYTSIIGDSFAEVFAQFMTNLYLDLDNKSSNEITMKGE